MIRLIINFDKIENETYVQSVGGVGVFSLEFDAFNFGRDGFKDI